MAASVAAIAAAAIGAAGSIGGGIIASRGAAAAARAGRGNATRVPLPDYANALDRYTARLLAANATNVAPSFTDWLKSGGTATFPMHDVGLDPKQAARLGIVDPKTGKAVPFVSPDQTQLTPEQVLYLGQQRNRAANAQGQRATGPAARYARVSGRLQRMEDRPQTAGRQVKEERVSARKSHLEDILGISE